MTLTMAIKKLETMFPSKTIAMIEFEDGSGSKFNYRIQGEQKNRFIDFTQEINPKEFFERFMSAKTIMDKWTKAVIVLAIISITLSSCSRYYVSGNCNGGSCGVWYPKKFNK
jgi:hypothetical protein